MSIRELKQRIVSVKKTKKMTAAMKMVAAAKFKRATDRITSARVYGEALNNILNELLARSDADYEPVYFKPNGAKKRVCIVLTGDRGLCGGFNANVLKQTTQYLSESEDPTELLLIGNKGQLYFKSRPTPIYAQQSNSPQLLAIEEAKQLLVPLLDQFVQGEIGQIDLIYTRFKSALTSVVEQKQLVPFVLPEAEKDEQGAEQSDFFYEPGKETVVDSLVEDQLVFSVFLALLNSNAAEQGARMAAMDAATDNASEMIQSLTLLFNRTRQALITKEITEIVGGAEALQ